MNIKKILYCLAILLLFCFVRPSAAMDVTFQWDANTEPDIDGYKIYYGFSTRSYENSVDVGDQTTYTLSGLEDGYTYYFAVTAYDIYGNESDFSNEVTASSSAPKQPPTADAGPDQTVDENVIVTLNGLNSFDTDDGIASFFWEQIDGPTVDLLDPAAEQTTFTAPGVGQDGVALIFRLTVTDNGGLQSSDSCLVNVSWVNEPPLADGGSDQTVYEGNSVMLDGSGSRDPDDGIASYLWEQEQGPQVAISDVTAIQTTFIAPEVGPEGGSLTFRLTVTDKGSLKATDNCIVNVANGLNVPPTAEAGPDQTVYEGDSVTLDGSNSTDPDDGIASYHWTQISGSPVTLNDAGAVRPTFLASAVGPKGVTLAFQLTVSDNGGLQSSDSCNVMVTQASSGTDLTGSWIGLNRICRRRTCWIKGRFNVVNLGNQKAQSSSLHFFLSTDATFDGSDVLFYKTAIVALEAGESINISLKAKFPEAETSGHIIAVVDSNNAISEADENNNIIVSWPLN